MSELASPAQLRAGLLRWTLFLGPLILLLGFASGAVSGSGAENPWFAGLVKPPLYPPPLAFPVVWSLLYVMMGLALALVVTARGAQGRGLAVAAFTAQLAINLVWSPLFFRLHQIEAALLLLLVLDLAVIATVLLFHRVRLQAALLLLPYLGWCLFATVLNWQFLEANPDANGAAAYGLEASGAAVTVEFK